MNHTWSTHVLEQWQAIPFTIQKPRITDHFTVCVVKSVPFKCLSISHSDLFKCSIITEPAPLRINCCALHTTIVSLNTQDVISVARIPTLKRTKDCIDGIVSIV